MNIDFMFKTWFIKSPDILYCFVESTIDFFFLLSSFIHKMLYCFMMKQYLNIHAIIVLNILFHLIQFILSVPLFFVGQLKCHTLTTN